MRYETILPIVFLVWAFVLDFAYFWNRCNSLKEQVNHLLGIVYGAVLALLFHRLMSLGIL